VIIFFGEKVIFLFKVTLEHFKKVKKSDVPGLLWTLLAVLFILAIIVLPEAVFRGAASGLKAWLEIVLPGLLPFFIVSEILMKLGFVNFIGVLLEPVMRPLFNVPGAGSFVMVMGLTSGSPVSSLIIARLRQQRLCTRVEAERMLSFTSFCSPVFMLSAVAVGMLGQPGLGIVIAGSHYFANIIIGLCLRFYGRGDFEYTPSQKFQGWPVKEAFRVLLRHQRQEKQPFGEILGEAITSSVNKVFNLGGYIILFSVIIKVFTQVGIMQMLASCLGFILGPLGFSIEILIALASGIFETTIGAKIACEASTSLIQKLLAVALMLGWSGISVQAQVASMIAGTDIRLHMFIVTRAAQALLAAFFTWFLYGPLNLAGNITLPAIITQLW